MALRASGRLLYWTGFLLQITSYRYCEKKKRYVQHTYFIYKIALGFLKIGLLWYDLPVGFVVLACIRWISIPTTVGIAITGELVKWLSRFCVLVILISWTHIRYYQRKIMKALNKVLDISNQLENCYFSEDCPQYNVLTVGVLIFVALVRLTVDIFIKLKPIVYPVAIVYYNSLFNIIYMVMALYQMQLIEWRSDMARFITEFINSEGWRSRIQMERLMSCLKINNSIVELQRSCHEICNTFAYIVASLVLNFINPVDIFMPLHIVSILVLSHLTDQNERLYEEFLNKLHIVSLHLDEDNKMMSREHPIMVSYQNYTLFSLIFYRFYF